MANNTNKPGKTTGPDFSWSIIMKANDTPPERFEKNVMLLASGAARAMLAKRTTVGIATCHIGRDQLKLTVEFSHVPEVAAKGGRL
jgi:hypothetical protein